MSKFTELKYKEYSKKEECLTHSFRHDETLYYERQIPPFGRNDGAVFKGSIGGEGGGGAAAAFPSSITPCRGQSFRPEGGISLSDGHYCNDIEKSSAAALPFPHNKVKAYRS